MKYFLVSSLLFLVSSPLLACPNCHATAEDTTKPPFNLIIIGIFILLTYIPFYILFSASKRYDPNRPENADK